MSKFRKYKKRNNKKSEKNSCSLAEKLIFLTVLIQFLRELMELIKEFL